MLTPREVAEITSLLHREVVPATGCTEPAAVALTVAYAASLVSAPIDRIEVALSANMLKNAMGVGIPGTGMTGIPIAIALGAVLAEPAKQLELLDTFTPEELATARSLVDAGRITIDLKEGANVDKLFIEVNLYSQVSERAHAIIQHTHTGLSALDLGGEDRMPSMLPETPCGCPEEAQSETSAASGESSEIALTFDMVYDYALQAPVEELDFIYEAAQQNKRAACYALSHSCGHSLGKLLHSSEGMRFMGDSPLTHMISWTSCACDARMDGAPVTVMSTTGSGNQGISSMLPVLTFAEDQRADRERTSRAILMSTCLVIYIKQLLGRLSCLCGMVISGVGTAAAVTYLMGGSREQSAGAVKNMVGNVSGMICDGAKPSCSLKASTGVSSAMISALLAMQGHVVTATEGIVDDSVDACVRNLAELGRDGMIETDQRVLQMMTHKGG